MMTINKKVISSKVGNNIQQFLKRSTYVPSRLIFILVTVLSIVFLFSSFNSKRLSEDPTINKKTKYEKQSFDNKNNSYEGQVGNLTDEEWHVVDTKDGAVLYNAKSKDTYILKAHTIYKKVNSDYKDVVEYYWEKIENERTY